MSWTSRSTRSLSSEVVNGIAVVHVGIHSQARAYTYGGVPFPFVSTHVLIDRRCSHASCIDRHAICWLHGMIEIRRCQQTEVVSFCFHLILGSGNSAGHGSFRPKGSSGNVAPHARPGTTREHTHTHPTTPALDTAYAPRAERGCPHTVWTYGSSLAGGRAQM